MSLLSEYQILSSQLVPSFCEVTTHKKIFIPMRDGVRLNAVRLEPKLKPSALKSRHARDAAELGFPTVLIRTPYHIVSFIFVGEMFCSYGYHVIVQDVRGRGMSEGEFEPARTEAEDGQDTIGWIRAQPWFQQCPYVGIWGLSYQGIAQFASICPENPYLQPDALVPAQSSAQMHAVLRPDNGIALELYTRWMYWIHHTRHKEAKHPLWMFSFIADPIRHVCRLPVNKIHERVTGDPEPQGLAKLFLPHILEDADSEHWRTVDFRPKLPFAPPCHLVGGWFDLFLKCTLADYDALLQAGRQTPYLTIGPWNHTQLGSVHAGFHITLRWFEAHLRHRNRRNCSGQPAVPPATTSQLPHFPLTTAPATYDRPSIPPDSVLPVSLYIMGRYPGWRQFPVWPPPSTPVAMYLSSGKKLTWFPPQGVCPPSSYIYDPMHPTPSWGGAMFNAVFSGSNYNVTQEIRKDVLRFTTPPVTRQLEFIGRVRAVLYFATTSAQPDLFVRLCVASPRLVLSATLCDGYLRLRPDSGQITPDGLRRVEIDMWATAFRLAPGERLRVTVCSAAHPRYQRSNNTPDVLAPVTKDSPKSRQWIYHDLMHPSCVIIPVTSGL